jgi:hypothetical protein
MHPVYDSIVSGITHLVNEDPLNPFFRGKIMAIVGNDDNGYPLSFPPFNYEVPPWSAIGIDIDLHRKSIPYPSDTRPEVIQMFRVTKKVTQTPPTQD